MDGVGLPELLGCPLRQSEVPNLALTAQLRHGLHGFHYRNAEITAVQVVEVNHVSVQAAEAGFCRLPDVGRIAANSRVPVRGVALYPEFRCQLDLVAPLLQEPAHEFLVSARSLSFLA